jgi:hypothetical protein
MPQRYPKVLTQGNLFKHALREQVRVNTLRLGGPNDGFRSRPFARGVS